MPGRDDDQEYIPPGVGKPWPDEPGPQPTWADHAWTAQEVRFVSEVLRHGNMTQAHIAAFPDRYGREDAAGADQRIRARIAGPALARRPYIAAYLAEVRAQMVASMQTGKDDILLELAKIARVNMADFMVLQEDGHLVTDLSGLNEFQMAAIQEVSVDTWIDRNDPREREVKSVKVKLAPKLVALELLGKHHKLFTEVVETSDTTDAAATIMDRRRKAQARRALEAQGKSDDDE